MCQQGPAHPHTPRSGLSLVPRGALQMMSIESPQHKETCTLLTRNKAAIQLAVSTSLEGLHH